MKKNITIDPEAFENLSDATVKKSILRRCAEADARKHIFTQTVITLTLCVAMLLSLTLSLASPREEKPVETSSQIEIQMIPSEERFWTEEEQSLVAAAVEGVAYGEVLEARILVAACVRNTQRDGYSVEEVLRINRYPSREPSASSISAVQEFMQDPDCNTEVIYCGNKNNVSPFHRTRTVVTTCGNLCFYK